MNSALRVFRNSVWLIFQPLVLNLLSIAVVGYIARVLGQVDYGKFVFAFSLVAMCMPLANMGLRALTVREVAVQRHDPVTYVGRILAARFALALLTLLVIFGFILVVHYDKTTRILVVIASLSIVSSAFASTYQDVLQGLEKMREVALSQLFGGICLTAMSLCVLLLGFGLYSVAGVYVFGNVVTTIVAYVLTRRAVGSVPLSWDWSFTKDNLKKAAPFFYPTIVATAGMKIGTVLLSATGHDAAVGLFGAANGLVERLLVVPDGICAAIYPTLIVLNQESPDEARQLYKKYLEYMLALAMPIAVGGTLLARPIMLLVYGEKFVEGTRVLQILVWWLCILFIVMLQSWTLSAIHKEKKPALVGLVSTPIYVALNALLIPWALAEGTAWANVGAAFASLVMLSYFVHSSFVANALPIARFIRVICANATMGIVVYFVQTLNIFLGITVGAVTYAISLLVFGIVRKSDLDRVQQLLAKKFGGRASVAAS